MMDPVLNFLIFVITLLILVRFFRKEGNWDPDRVRKTFRFYTCQSNVLCALSALAMGIAQLAGDVPQWVWIFKYIGTASVTVTMLTVFLFLAPSAGKDWYAILLKGANNLFMHLITPILAIVSFCLLEKRGMTFAESLWGLLPLIVYGQHYLYRILCAPEGRKWDDFYGFNKQGKWPLAFGMMLAGTFAVCMLFLLAQNA
jgi:hypothetical protein